MKQKKTYLTISEYAKKLGLSVQSIYSRKKSGSLKIEIFNKIQVIDADKYPPILLPAGRKKPTFPENK